MVGADGKAVRGLYAAGSMPTRSGAATRPRTAAMWDRRW
ncbi:hypothetical protein [Novosphingobium sp. BL-52-GroH]